MKEKNCSKISIITPTFNSEQVIIYNVQSVIKQCYNNFEHIIVDNKSTDNTINIVKDLYQKYNLSDKLTIICEKDFGIADAFNKGIKAATGDIIGILNSDDRLFNDKVFLEISKAFESEKILFIHGDILFEDSTYGSNIRKPKFEISSLSPYHHPTMYFRKSVYENYGYYDTEFTYSMDFELMCRLNKLIPHFNDKGKYIDDFPLVIMSAGGASWRNEKKVALEEKKSLKTYDFWNVKTCLKHYMRYTRVLMKIYLLKLGMRRIITLWRAWKWR